MWLNHIVLSMLNIILVYMVNKSFMYTVQYKNGVPTDTLCSVMNIYVNIIAYIHFKLFKIYMVITSTTDGKHMQNSLHYKGLAFDVRTMDKTDSQVNQFVNFLKFHFDKTLDIVIEKDHLHIEYDPK